MVIEPIATLEGCYPEKFGIPRQARIVKAARAEVRLLATYQSRDFLDGLIHFSHIWLIFGFHQNEWRGDAKVRPQRLGGNQKMGVFATRSPYRPNGLGLSAVEVVGIDYDKAIITVAGHDLVNGTPIYDIKPYVPFTDSILEATSSFAVDTPEKHEVLLASEVDVAFNELNIETQSLIKAVIGQNPLPPYHQASERVYGVTIENLNIRFKHCATGFMILEIHRNF